jgi:hypothetical protein
MKIKIKNVQLKIVWQRYKLISFWSFSIRSAPLSSYRERKESIMNTALSPRIRTTYARVRNPPVGLHQSSGTEIFILVPPVRGARRRAAGAEDAFVHAVELAAVFGRLEEFAWDEVG